MIIDQLPLLGGDVQGTDEFPIERGTTTYKTTQAALVKTATDAAAAAQAAADDANAKGLPPGGTAGQVLTKADSSDYSASWEDPSGGDVTADMIGIVITGARPAVAVTAGQYVIVRGSTITGITDGLYINSSGGDLSPSTDVTAADLTEVTVGGLNAGVPIARSVQNTDAISQLVSENNDGTLKSSVYTDLNFDYPWFSRTKNGATANSGLVLAHTGITHTEFNYFNGANLIGLTFWTSGTTYYRLCIGINGSKALFFEYYDGSTTTRMWTATVS